MGKKITARVAHALRGGEIVKRHKGGDITAEFYTPKKITKRLSADEFVSSKKYEEMSGHISL